MEFGSLLLAFLLGGFVFAPIINAIDGVLGHTIAKTTRSLAKSAIIFVLDLGDRVKVASAELGEAFQDLVAEAQAARRVGEQTSVSTPPPPTEVEIETESVD